MIIEIILISIGFIFSFLFSGLETAFVSSNKLKIRHLEKEGNPRAISLQKLIKTPENILAVTLIGNNLAIVLTAVMFNYLIQRIHPGLDELMYSLYSTLILTPFMLIFAEVIPKALFYYFATGLALYAVSFIKALYFLFYPFIRLIVEISNLLSKLLKINSDKNRYFHNLDEFTMIFQMGAKQGIVESDEQEMLHSILSFSNKTRAREIMTPLVDVECIEIDLPREEIIEVIKKQDFSRIPVYKERVDNIIGYINTIEYIYADDDKDIEPILKEGYFVPETKSIGKLLFEMRSRNKPMVFVVDEYGGTSGVITSVNIAEEVVGEILEEKEESEINVFENENFIEVVGEADVDDLNDKYNLEIEKDGFETISGFVSYIFGHIPKQDEKFDFKKYKYIVLKSTEKSVDKIRIEKIDDES